MTLSAGNGGKKKEGISGSDESLTTNSEDTVDYDNAYCDVDRAYEVKFIVLDQPSEPRKLRTKTTATPITTGGSSSSSSSGVVGIDEGNATGIVGTQNTAASSGSETSSASSLLCATTSYEDENNLNVNVGMNESDRKPSSSSIDYDWESPFAANWSKPTTDARTYTTTDYTRPDYTADYYTSSNYWINPVPSYSNYSNETNESCYIPPRRTSTIPKKPNSSNSNSSSQLININLISSSTAQGAMIASEKVVDRKSVTANPIGAYACGYAAIHSSDVSEPVYINLYHVRIGGVKFAGINGFLQNWLGWESGCGIYHVGLELHNVEWQFGYCPSGTGIFCIKPRVTRDHQYHESILVGKTSFTKTEVVEKIKTMQSSWKGTHYRMNSKNCVDFVIELCRILGTPTDSLNELSEMARKLPDLGYILSSAVSANLGVAPGDMNRMEMNRIQD